eukprot:13329099-Heterocapsa_arctica.AAC.1
MAAPLRRGRTTWCTATARSPQTWVRDIDRPARVDASRRRRRHPLQPANSCKPYRRDAGPLGRR